MADYVWPDGIQPFAASFYLQPHTGGTESPFSRAAKVYALSAPRWICRLSLRAPDSADRWGSDYAEWGEQVDAFLAKLQGGVNRVLLYDFRRPGGFVAFSNAAISQGDTAVTLTGASLGDIRQGEYIGGDGRPHIITGISVSGSDLVATVQPPFFADVGAGAATFSKVSGAFRLLGDDAGANMSEVGQLTQYDLEFVEDVEGLVAASLFSDLPTEATEGDTLMWAPTGEIIHWSDGMWRVASGAPLATVFATFAGSSGQAIDSNYEIDAWRTARDFSAKTGFQRIQAEKWMELDGSGGAAPFQDGSIGVHYLEGSMLVPSGASDWDGYMDVVPGADTSSNPFEFRTNAIHSSGVRIDNATGALQIADHIYGLGTGLPVARQAKLIPGYSSTDARRVFVRFNGRDITARDEATGIEIKGVSALAEGHLLGIHSRRTTSTFREVAAYPRDLKGYKQIGSMRFVGGRNFYTLAASGVVNGLDRGDHALIVFGTEFNTTGGGVPEANGPANLHLGRIDKADGHFTYLTEIDSNADATTTDRIVRLEGASIFEIGGVVHVATAGPDDGILMLYRCPDPDDLSTPGHWARTQINTQSVSNAECVQPVDLGDGAFRLICTYQGNTGAGGSVTGGILMLKYAGGDTLTASNWSEVIWVDCPGAWGLPKGEVIVDLLGDGRRLLPFGSRKNSRNTDGLGGAYYIDVDEGGVDSGGKTLETIYSTGAEDTTRLDFVDLGSGHGFDIAYAHDGSDDLNLLTNPRAAGAWAKSTVTLPTTTAGNPFNVWNSGHTRNGKSVILVVIGVFQNGGLYAVSHDGSAWGYEILHRMPVDHTFEKPFLFRLSLDNGLYYWIGGDDNGNMVRAFAFIEEEAQTAQPPAIVYPTQAETDALVAAMSSAPSDARILTINRAIYRLKQAGAWEYIDALWMLAAHHQQAGRLNWKNPSTFTATVNSAPVFTADRGYQFDGTDDYLATGYNPTSASLGYALNDAHLGVVTLANTAGNTPDLGTANDVSRLVNRGSVATSFAVNRTAAATSSATGLLVPVPCHALVMRNASNSQRLFVNGQLFFSNTGASNTLATEFYIGRGGSSYSPRPIACAHVGRAFPTDEMAQEASLAIQEYMAAVGVLG